VRANRKQIEEVEKKAQANLAEVWGVERKTRVPTREEVAL